MWIRMISTAAGPRLPHALLSEKVYQVEDELGEELVALRAAEEVADPNPKQAPAAPAAAEAETETAAIADGETAENPAADKKSETLMDKLKPKTAESKAAKKS